MEVYNWVVSHWVEVCAALWCVDQLLKIVAPLTPWSFDDNLSDAFGKFLARFLPKKP